MTLKEHYRFSRRKSIKPYIKLFILIILVMSVSPTFSRYTNMSGANASSSIAKWSIKINNETITSGTDRLTNSIDLLNTYDDSTKIDSGDTCYFELTIDPATTEVAISYSILVNLTASSNLPAGTKILKYEKYIYANNIETLDSTNNINTTVASITENIMLPTTHVELSSTSKVKYKFYCKLPFPIDTTKNDTYTVAPNISLEQYISE